MVAMINNETTAVPLEEVAGKLKYNTDRNLIKEAKLLGISFGEKDE